MSLTLVVALSALTAVLVVFALAAQSKPATIVALVLMGGFGFATVPPLQMRVMSHAGKARTLASGANIAAFNVGNAIGACSAADAVIRAVSSASIGTSPSSSSVTSAVAGVFGAGARSLRVLRPLPQGPFRRACRPGFSPD